MTREEEIDKAGLEWYSKVQKYDADVATAFLAGAQWADAHPHWISVEDEMPPMSDEDGMSDKVLTHSKGGGIYFNRYDYGHNTWGNPFAFNVTHWMPLPQAPKKGGDQ